MRLRNAAPKAMGRMMVPTPAANTSVMPRIWLRLRKLEAKNAGNMTEAQHGTRRATPPPRNAARIVVESKTCPMNELQSIPVGRIPNYYLP